MIGARYAEFAALAGYALSAVSGCFLIMKHPERAMYSGAYLTSLASLAFVILYIAGDMVDRPYALAHAAAAWGTFIIHVAIARGRA